VTVATRTVWEHGRFDARHSGGKILFGRMYEDTSIEMAAFTRSDRIFCIASAGCTAIALATSHQVVAVDINRVQLAYARRRLGGGLAAPGAAERLMSFGRWFSPLIGWSDAHLDTFLDLQDPGQQIGYWQRHLDTARFRATVDAAFSLAALRLLYAAPFLDFLPTRLGAVMRARMARCFARHSNRENPYARALLQGELPPSAAPWAAGRIRLEHADAACYLEAQPPASFDGFALSNILDGADAAYRRRLQAAVLRTATPGAVVVQRSFREPPATQSNNRAADDRSMLWGLVEVGPAAEICQAHGESTDEYR
jgi:S-adenosylmethionine:diacylglycerol 3-amino-3-carboxypropyl transferase